MVELRRLCRDGEHGGIFGCVQQEQELAHDYTSRCRLNRLQRGGFIREQEEAARQWILPSHCGSDV